MLASVPTNPFRTVRHTRHTSACREDSCAAASGLHNDGDDHWLASVRGAHPLPDRPPHPLLKLVGIRHAISKGLLKDDSNPVNHLVKGSFVEPEAPCVNFGTGNHL